MLIVMFLSMKSCFLMNGKLNEMENIFLHFPFFFRGENILTYEIFKLKKFKKFFTFVLGWKNNYRRRVVPLHYTRETSRSVRKCIEKFPADSSSCKWVGNLYLNDIISPEAFSECHCDDKNNKTSWSFQIISFQFMI